MLTSRCFLYLLSAIVLVTAARPAPAQGVIKTVNVGTAPDAAAVNPVTNKAYVANYASGNLTVIDGASFSTQTVTVGTGPIAVAVNSVNNKIYVVNYCGPCTSGTVTVIDGASNQTATVTVGYLPNALAVNSVTNKIYVANTCKDSTCQSGSVTVIDGNTLSSQTVMVGLIATAAVVNSVTNKIYVPNCGSDLFCQSSGTVAVIDGTTLSIQTVSVGVSPGNTGVNNAAINSVTDKIYVANYCGNDPSCNRNSKGTVSVIDGATLSTQTVALQSYAPAEVAVNAVTNEIYVTDQCGSDPTCQSAGILTVIDGNTLSVQAVTVGIFPDGVGVDPVTNEIYVANRCGNDPTCSNPAGTVTAISGATNSGTLVVVGSKPWAVAIDSVTNRIYVPNYADGTVSVIAGTSAAALQFVATTPCRLVDTRQANGEFGGPSLQANSTRIFPIPSDPNCSIPSSAAAYSVNLTVVPPPNGTLGYLTAWPTGEDQPYVSTLNSDGRVKANAAIVPAGYQGAVSFYATDTTDLILDIDGYFEPASGSTLAFYPLPPCRVVDTRTGQGGPTLQGEQEYDYAIQGICGIPTAAQAYSLNFTVIPDNVAVGYLTVWPQGQMQPPVSTLNDPTATVVANAGIVPAGGNGGEISAYVYTTGQANLLVDVNGYFAPPGQGGFSLYPVAPCRVLDTRGVHGPFSGTLNPPVDVLGSPCAPSSQSQAYVFNATVAPQGSLGYLTLWPDGIMQPTVSTLNAYDGAITSNMAIVPAGNGGKIDAFAGSGLTNLILDISSYFAP